jgi:hypothetical protein
MSEMTVRESSAPILSTKAESLIAEGDLAPLSPDERLAYYRMRCEAAGLDYRTVPFLYVKLNGKLVLYPTKGATEQIGEKRNISIKILSKGWDEESYEVWCRASDASGRSVENGAMVTAGHLQGEALCNAKMKAITKATRRTILAFAGMGMIDESEIDDLSGAKKVSVNEAHNSATPLRIVAGETIDADGVINGETVEAQHTEQQAEQKQEKKKAVPVSTRLRKAVRMVWAKAGLKLTMGPICTALGAELEDEEDEPDNIDTLVDAALIRLIRYAMTGQAMLPDAILPLPEEMLAEAKAFIEAA